MTIIILMIHCRTVSYTHLDVYKRQLLLWLCFFLLLLYYKQISSFLRQKLVKKETVVCIQEKKIIVERKMHLEEEPGQTGLYELDDGTILDSEKGILMNGEKTKKLRPQVVALLKLFLRTENYRLTAEEIDKGLWQGKGKPNQLYGVIHHLRESLKGISSLVVEYRDEYYCLKMPHSIEKMCIRDRTYTRDADNEITVVYVYDIAGKKEYPVTDKWYNSSSPVFSTDRCV